MMPLVFPAAAPADLEAFDQAVARCDRKTVRNFLNNCPVGGSETSK